MRRTNPAKWGNVDDACGEYARRGLVEVHPELGDDGVFWASDDPLPGALGRVVAVLTHTGVERKEQNDAPENLRKMYDRANEMRRADVRFRALLDSVLKNSLVYHFHRDKLSREDIGPAETIALLSPSPDELQKILAQYPDPPKFRIRRRASR